MKFLADENFEPQFVERLREEGYEVLFLDEYQGGTEDEEVLGFAVLKMLSSSPTTKILAS